MRWLPHILKKVAEKANAKVVFSAPNQLGKLCKLTNPLPSLPEKCIKWHQNKLVECAAVLCTESHFCVGGNLLGQSGVVSITGYVSTTTSTLTLVVSWQYIV